MTAAAELNSTVCFVQRAAGQAVGRQLAAPSICCRRTARQRVTWPLCAAGSTPSRGRFVVVVPVVLQRGESDDESVAAAAARAESASRAAPHRHAAGQQQVGQRCQLQRDTAAVNSPCAPPPRSNRWRPCPARPRGLRARIVAVLPACQGRRPCLRDNLVGDAAGTAARLTSLDKARRRGGGQALPRGGR